MIIAHGSILLYELNFGFKCYVEFLPYIVYYTLRKFSYFHRLCASAVYNDQRLFFINARIAPCVCLSNRIVVLTMPQES